MSNHQRRKSKRKLKRAAAKQDRNGIASTPARKARPNAETMPKLGSNDDPMRRVIVSYRDGEYSLADATGVTGIGIVEIAESDWLEVSATPQNG